MKHLHYQDAVRKRTNNIHHLFPLSTEKCSSQLEYQLMRLLRMELIWDSLMGGDRDRLFDLLLREDDRRRDPIYLDVSSDPESR